MKRDSSDWQWRRTALGRLKFELAGISFAMKAGFNPEDYADHLWSTGAVKWMGKTAPTSREYLLKEADAFQILYPKVIFEIVKSGEEEAELVFKKKGCLGGWGQNQWSMTNSFGLGKGHVCRYCRQAFRIWSGQLGLQACPEPRIDGTCILRVRK
jgi:hypothetical protein